jgi:peptidoglycan hydrolase CwlO-like protein
MPEQCPSCEEYKKEIEKLKVHITELEEDIEYLHNAIANRVGL